MSEADSTTVTYYSPEAETATNSEQQRSIIVAVRVRPLSEKERVGGNENIIDTLDSRTLQYNGALAANYIKQQNPKNAKEAAQASATIQFTFDNIYDDLSSAHNSQELIFKDLGIRLVNNSFEGFNCTLLAYGQTGSGKTHTMLGRLGTVIGSAVGFVPPPNANTAPPGHNKTPTPTPTAAAKPAAMPVGDSGRPAHFLVPVPQAPEDAKYRGLIPRIVECILQRMQQQTKNNSVFQLQAQFIEIYCEKLRDLLNPDPVQDLKIRQHPKQGTTVDGASSHKLTSVEDLESLLATGYAYRTTSSTAMNSQSSRSHAILTLKLVSVVHNQATNAQTTKSSTMHLVDLAGSEKVDDTGVEVGSTQFKEGANINLSLTNLGRVIRALSLASQKAATGKKTSSADESFIPYRESQLTWLLKESLGGNSLTTIVACVSGAASCAAMTLSTLRYAAVAKQVTNKVKANEEVQNAQVIKSLKAEVEVLKTQLQQQSLLQSEVALLRSLLEQRKDQLPANLLLNLNGSTNPGTPLPELDDSYIASQQQPQYSQPPTPVNRNSTGSAPTPTAAPAATPANNNGNAITSLANSMIAQVRKTINNLGTPYVAISQCISEIDDFLRILPPNQVLLIKYMSSNQSFDLQIKDLNQEKSKLDRKLYDMKVYLCAFVHDNNTLCMLPLSNQHSVTVDGTTAAAWSRNYCSNGTIIRVSTLMTMEIILPKTFSTTPPPSAAAAAPTPTPSTTPVNTPPKQPPTPSNKATGKPPAAAAARGSRTTSAASSAASASAAAAANAATPAPAPAPAAATPAPAPAAAAAAPALSRMSSIKKNSNSPIDPDIPVGTMVFETSLLRLHEGFASNLECSVTTLPVLCRFIHRLKVKALQSKLFQALQKASLECHGASEGLLGFNVQHYYQPFVIFTTLQHAAEAAGIPDAKPTPEFLSKQLLFSYPAFPLSQLPEMYAQIVILESDTSDMNNPKIPIIYDKLNYCCQRIANRLSQQQQQRLKESVFTYSAFKQRVNSLLQALQVNPNLGAATPGSNSRSLTRATITSSQNYQDDMYEESVSRNVRSAADMYGLDPAASKTLSNGLLGISCVWLSCLRQDMQLQLQQNVVDQHGQVVGLLNVRVHVRLPPPKTVDPNHNNGNPSQTSLHVEVEVQEYIHFMKTTCGACGLKHANTKHPNSLYISHSWLNQSTVLTQVCDLAQKAGDTLTYQLNRKHLHVVVYQSNHASSMSFSRLLSRPLQFHVWCEIDCSMMLLPNIETNHIADWICVSKQTYFGSHQFPMQPSAQSASFFQELLSPGSSNNNNNGDDRGPMYEPSRTSFASQTSQSNYDDDDDNGDEPSVNRSYSKGAPVYSSQNYGTLRGLPTGTSTPVMINPAGPSSSSSSSSNNDTSVPVSPSVGMHSHMNDIVGTHPSTLLVAVDIQEKNLDGDIQVCHLKKQQNEGRVIFRIQPEYQHAFDVIVQQTDKMPYHLVRVTQINVKEVTKDVIANGKLTRIVHGKFDSVPCILGEEKIQKPSRRIRVIAPWPQELTKLDWLNTECADGVRIRILVELIIQTSVSPTPIILHHPVTVKIYGNAFMKLVWNKSSNRLARICSHYRLLLTPSPVYLLSIMRDWVNQVMRMVRAFRILQLHSHDINYRLMYPTEESESEEFHVQPDNWMPLDFFAIWSHRVLTSLVFKSPALASASAISNSNVASVAAALTRPPSISTSVSSLSRSPSSSSPNSPMSLSPSSSTQVSPTARYSNLNTTSPPTPVLGPAPVPGAGGSVDDRSSALSPLSPRRS